MPDGTSADEVVVAGSNDTHAGVVDGGMHWGCQVAPSPEGGFVWNLWPEDPRWAGAVTGRAASRAEAEQAARTVTKRCTVVGRAALDASGLDVCRVVTLFPEEPAGGSAAVRRLSVCAPPAAFEDARWNDLERRALEWQTRGGRQTFVASDTFSDESGWRLRDLFGCMGAFGEQLTLACAAVGDLSEAKALPDSPQAELIRRAWAEHAMHWIMAAGHMFLNIVGRAVALDPAVHPHLLHNQDADSNEARKKAIRTVFPCESDAHKDWPTFSRPHANFVRRAAAKSAVPAVVDMGDLIHRIAVDRRWKAMSDLRGDAFHRWRAQTAGVSTTTKRSPRVVGDDGLLPNGIPHDVRGPETSTNAIQYAEDALGLLGDAMSEFDRLLPTVMKRLTVSRLCDDGLLVVMGALPIIETSPGTGAALLVLTQERDGAMLDAITEDGGN
jgi:hypothetical protein